MDTKVGWWNSGDGLIKIPDNSQEFNSEQNGSLYKTLDIDLSVEISLLKCDWNHKI